MDKVVASRENIYLLVRVDPQGNSSLTTMMMMKWSLGDLETPMDIETEVGKTQKTQQERHETFS